MTRGLALGAATALLASVSTLVFAQEQPEDLLPPGFDQPEPAPTPRPSPTSVPSPIPVPGSAGVGPAMRPGEVVQALPSGGGRDVPDASDGNRIDLARLPSLEQLERMSPDELDELFGLKPRVDIPAAAQRDMVRVGVFAPEEGGLPVFSLARQPATLVRAALSGSTGTMVSRWGHILLRRTLASRLEQPEGMDPAEFVALRAALLNRMGEYGVARALVQDVDTANYTPPLTNAALDAYLGTGDVLGACPAVRLARSEREDGEWRMTAAICSAYSGEGTSAGNALRRLTNSGRIQQIDGLLAQRYAGAAGEGRRSVTIEWKDVGELTLWRVALANAVGAEVPNALWTRAGPRYSLIAATAPMLSPAQRWPHAAFAARRGVLSSAALVELYSQLYAEGSDGPYVGPVANLRTAYVGIDADARLSAIKALWSLPDIDPHGALVLTAYAAARLDPAENLTEDAGQLVASMLAAGLDRDAARWESVVESGSLGWALLTLALPQDRQASGGQIGDFVGTDAGSGQAKSRMLIAGLAALGRVSSSVADNYADDLGVNLQRSSRWTQAIARAAANRNQALVALLAGVGMQGDDWSQMTPLHLYHVVKSLNDVGLRAEARMIAAEAVARA